MAATKKYSNVEQELTRILLTELLAHQFAFPVQWITTQDTILRDFATERLVEIGPAETLVNMAKRTLKAGYESYDIALGLKRELLSFKKNADTIYYRPSEDETAPISAPGPVPQEATAASITTSASEPTPRPVVAPPSAVLSLPDKAVSPLDIITVLVAVALKKQASDLAQDQSIKALCGGRSTVQNEVIGDLAKELGPLPDQPEDMSLMDLGNLLAESRLGTKLGPCTNALVGKVATVKMPAGSSVTTLRQYLDRRWGFKQGLQDRALLLTISPQPVNRLASEKELHSFLDETAHTVLRGIGVDPAALSTSSRSGQHSAESVAVSSEALKSFQNKQRIQDQAFFDLYAKRLGKNAAGGDHERDKLKTAVEELQAKLDLWSAEHGEVYEKGIAPMFDAKKARKYDSSWNWAVQDVVTLFSATLLRHLSAGELEGRIREGLDKIPTKATPQLTQVIGHLLSTLKDVPESPNRQVAREWLQELQRTCKLAILSKDARCFKFSVTSTVPILHIDEQGKATVQEKPRIAPLFDQSPTPAASCDNDSNQSYSPFDVSTPLSGPSPTGTPSISVFSRHPLPGQTETAIGAGTPLSSALSDAEEAAAAAIIITPPAPSGIPVTLKWTPKLQTKSRSSGWRTNHDITNTYLRWFHRCQTEGISLANKAILITGAGKDSIGSSIVSICLSAGARVLVTTSSYSKPTSDYYQSLYRQHGALTSQLVVVPFNGGSHQDVERLVAYIYDTLGWGDDGGLDHIVPFAAVGEAGRALDQIDGRSELAHRVMLTNLVRLLGAVKAAKKARRIATRPTHVLLPLSPNHGVFGQDGLYAESKIGLEALLNKWWSEDWSEYLTLCGAVIGWTRGTGLMGGNDLLATGIEADLGIRTFSAEEMAWHVVGLMDEGVASFCDLEPLMADLSGGLSADFVGLKGALGEIRESIEGQRRIKRGLWREGVVEREGMGVGDGNKETRVVRRKKARIAVEKVSMPGYQDLLPLAARLQDMVDLEGVVVVTGYGEIGPCGSARTRWEAEYSGTFSIDACVELAWIMGLIKYHKTGRVQGKDYCGWIDVKSGDPISDTEVKTKYEDHIIQHTGIRLVEQQVHDLVSPESEQKLHEVAITEDLEPFEVSVDTANELKRQHGDNAIVTETEGGQYTVTLKAGATLWIAKAIKSKSMIGAPMPAGWDPKIYGIADDIISQVDPVTIYALVATVECLLSAGITDPYELYKHMHVSELGNAVGASLGGLRSLHNMFKRRLLDGQVQNDILAETFVNTTAAWINMLLLGSSGPIRTPVGACATSLESIDTGYDLIMNGRAKAVLVGGTDGLERDIAHEFANMNATIDGDKDAAAGRTPKEASRPTTSTRAGFVEGHGCGVQLLTTARLAIDMGLPIRGIIALSHTASDKIGRSVPSPGKGILTIATEKRDPASTSGYINNNTSPLLDISYRRRQLSARLRQIKEKRDMEIAWLNKRLVANTTSNQQHPSESPSCPPASPNPNPENLPESYTTTLSQIHASARRSISEAQHQHGNLFYTHEPAISPLRGALAVWGLTVDDLSVASLHGTSTVKNDTNETSVIQSQLAFLGRTPGNVLPCVLQKSLLGHGKGAAGAFAVNGCLQMLGTGVVPGNRNADNIDQELRSRELLFFPSETYKSVGELKAFTVTSFGFGQKGAQLVGVHPRYVWAVLGRGEYDGYKGKVEARMMLADRALQEGIYGVRRFVEVKEKAVYDEAKVEESLLCR